MKIGDEVLVRGIVRGIQDSPRGRHINVNIKTTVGRKGAMLSMHITPDDIVAIESIEDDGAFDLGDWVVTPDDDVGIIFFIDEESDYPYEIGFVDDGGSAFFRAADLRPYTGDDDGEDDGEPGPPPPRPPLKPDNVAASNDFIKWLGDFLAHRVKV